MKVRRCAISSGPAALVVLCLYALAYGAMSAYLVSISTTLERRFELPSSRVGFLLGSNEIGGLLATLLVSYFGSKGNGARVLTFSAVGVTVSGIIFGLPIFIYGAKFSVMELVGSSSTASNLTNITHLDHCNASSQVNGTRGEQSNGDSRGYLDPNESLVGFIFMVISAILYGVFASPFWTVGVSLIDDIVGNASSGIYIGALYALRTIAPFIGFVVGSWSLSLHETLGISTKDYGPGQKDPRWIGAWYMGMFVFSIAVLVTVPLLALIQQPEPSDPNPNKAEYRVTKTHSAASSENSRSPNSSDTAMNKQVVDKGSNSDLSVKDLFIIMYKLLTNPVYAWISVSTIFHMTAFLPYYTYLAKYLEYGFLLVTSDATMAAGAVLSVSSVIAVLVSGAVDRFTNMSIRRMCLYNVCMAATSMTFIPFFFVFSCPITNIIGLHNSSYCGTIPCNCSEMYSPVCANGETFFSACHAGCSRFLTENSTYFDCSCANSTVGLRGACMEMCPQLYPFVILVFFFLMFNGMSSVQFTKILMRQTTPATKPVALGCISCVFLIMGMCLPPAVGKLIDLTCMIRQPGASNCLHYNGPKLGRTINILSISAIGPAIICQVMAWYVCPEDKTDDEVELKDVTKNNGSIE